MKQNGLPFVLSQAAALLVVPLVLLCCAVLELEHTALLSLVVAIASLLPFLFQFERRKPRPRDIVPVVVMGTLAALGRVAFAAIPGFKPTSAIVIISAAAFGPLEGFLTGALAAVGSNMMFGQGIWTPWQMYGWGLMGYVAGRLRSCAWFQTRWGAPLFGAVASVFYGWLLNLWYVAGFVRPVTPATVGFAYLASLPFDLSHAASTLIFLLLLYRPWEKKLRRIREKYGVGCGLEHQPVD